jgi:hypothetical protein
VLTDQNSRYGMAGRFINIEKSTIWTGRILPDWANKGFVPAEKRPLLSVDFCKVGVAVKPGASAFIKADVTTRLIKESVSPFRKWSFGHQSSPLGCEDYCLDAPFASGLISLHISERRFRGVATGIHQ